MAAGAFTIRHTPWVCSRRLSRIWQARSSRRHAEGRSEKAASRYNRRGKVPVNRAVLPMLAMRFDDLPSGADWIFEPKWDGFRTLIFRDHDEIQIQSRDEKPLNRYFPELVETLLEQL